MRDSEFNALIYKIKENDHSVTEVRGACVKVEKSVTKQRQDGTSYSSTEFDSNATDKRVAQLLKALEHNTKVDKIDMSDAHKSSIIPVISSLKSNKVVTTLNLYGAEIGSSVASQAMALPFMAIAPRETHIHLSHTSYSVCNLIKSNNMLTTLNLSYTSIRNEHAQKIFEALVDNKTLNKLLLDRNWINDDAITNIVENLKKNTSLKELSIKNNCLKKVDSIKELLSVSECNHDLKMFLGSNRFPQEELTSMGEIDSNIIDFKGSVSGVGSVNSGCDIM